MKGLLIKDFKLMATNKKFFVVFVGIALCLGFTMEDSFIAMSYLTMLGALYTLNTISYDEYDNGYPFLFSLPITKKQYVQSKYLLGIVMAVLACVIGFVFGYALSLINQTGESTSMTLILVLGSILSALLLLSFMIPIRFKYGGEKSQIAMIGIIGAVLIVGMVMFNVLKALNVDFTPLLEMLSSMNTIILSLVVIVIILGLLLFSYKMSLSIMNKKEF